MIEKTRDFCIKNQPRHGGDTMKTNFVRQTVLPVLAAFIWGTAFVAQSLGAELLPPFAFNAARSAVAFVFLLAVCLVLRAVRRGRGRPASSSIFLAFLVR